MVPALGLTPAEGHLPSLGVQAGMRTMAQLMGFDPAAVVSEGLETDISGNSLVHPDLQQTLVFLTQHKQVA